MDFKSIFEQERILAQQITEKTYNGKPGSGYQYFRVEEGKEYSNRGICIAFLAIEYDEFESHFLAGPFIHEDKHYGLVSIYEKIGLEPIQVYIDDMRKKQLQGDSTTYMPAAARQRVDQYFGASTFYFDDQTKQSYSSLDLEFGKKEIEPDVLKRLKKFDKCGVFFRTQGAAAKVQSLLTSKEISQWGQSLVLSANRLEEEMRKTQVCAEKPYYVHLAGTDDCSWGVALQSSQDVEQLINDIYDADNVSKLMWFTN